MFYKLLPDVSHKTGNVFSPKVYVIQFLVTLYNDMLFGRTDWFVVEKEFVTFGFIL